MTTTAHPLEKVFGMEPGSSFPETFKEKETIINPRASTLLDPTTGEMVERKSSPNDNELDKEERIEDLHIDGQLETIHDNAIDAFEQQSRMSQEVDPKFAARNAEVAAQYLNIALNAVNSRIDSKFKRQKIAISKKDAGTPNTVNNNLIVGDRNEILKMILDKKSAEIEVTNESK